MMPHGGFISDPEVPASSPGSSVSLGEQLEFGKEHVAMCGADSKALMS